jgi:hypothetical protein
VCTSEQQSDADGELRVLANGGLVRLASSSFPEIVQRLHRHGDKASELNRLLLGQQQKQQQERCVASNLDARGQMAAVRGAEPITLRMPRLNFIEAGATSVERGRVAAAIASRLTRRDRASTCSPSSITSLFFSTPSSVSSSAASLRRYIASAPNSSPQSARAPLHPRPPPPSKHAHTTSAHLHLIAPILRHGRRLG